MEQGRDAGRIGRFIDGLCCYAPLGAPDALPDAAGLPPALAQQGAELARRLGAVLADWDGDARLGRSDSVSEERLAALLADLRHFAAVLDYARH